MSLRGILRRAVRRRALQQAEETDEEEHSQKDSDEGFSTARQQLIGYFSDARRRIHPEFEELPICLDEESLTAAREKHECYLMQDLAVADRLDPVNKTRLLAGMTDWLERLDTEQKRVDCLVAELDSYMSAAAEFEHVSAKLAVIIDDGLFSMDKQENNLPDHRQ